MKKIITTESGGIAVLSANTSIEVIDKNGKVEKLTEKKVEDNEVEIEVNKFKKKKKKLVK